MPIDPITKTVTWHPGGAIRGPDGEPTPWPFGGITITSKRLYRTHMGFIRFQGIMFDEWHQVDCYADIDPPDFGGGADV